MSKTSIKGLNYTPVLDSLVGEYGLYVAAVFGRVWRYCQMEQGYCHAEQERIADELNIDRKTVNRALKILVRDGYLTDTTPNAKGRTRIYKDTGRAGIKGKPVPESPNPTPEPVPEVVPESPNPTPEPVPEVVPESPTKKVKKETTTTSSVVFSFLEKASQEQREAFDLVKRFASEGKAVEVASRENPTAAALDYLKWCANHGGEQAALLLKELQAKQQAAERPYWRKVGGDPDDVYHGQKQTPLH